MKKVLFILFFLFNLVLFGQDEVIERLTQKAADFKLKILEIKNDTLYSESYGTIEKIHVEDVIAYRIGSKKDSKYIFPNPNDTSLYYIINHEAVNKKELKNSTADGRRAFDALIEPYLADAAFKEVDIINYHYKLLNNKTGKKVQIPNKFDVLINLKEDKLGRMIPVRVNEILKDSLAFIVSTTYKKNRRILSIKENNLRLMKIETPSLFISRIALGITLLPTILTARILFIGHWYRTFDLTKDWDIIIEED